MKNFMIAASVLTMAVSSQADAATWIKYEVTATGTGTFYGYPNYERVTRTADIKLTYSVQIENTGFNPVTGSGDFIDPRSGAFYSTQGSIFNAFSSEGTVEIGRNFLGVDIDWRSRADGFVSQSNASIQFIDMLQQLAGWPTVPGDYRATGVLDFNTLTRSSSSRVFGLVTNFRVLGATDGYYAPSLSLVTYVPEPASWAMMIVGVGVMGGMMRRRSSQRVTVSYA